MTSNDVMPPAEEAREPVGNETTPSPGPGTQPEALPKAGAERLPHELAAWAGGGGFARQRTTTEIKRINALNLEPASPAIGEKAREKIRPKQNQMWGAGKGAAPRDGDMKADFQRSLVEFKKREERQEKHVGSKAGDRPTSSGNEPKSKLNPAAKEFSVVGAQDAQQQALPLAGSGTVPAAQEGAAMPAPKPQSPPPEFALKQDKNIKRSLGDILDNFLKRANQAEVGGAGWQDASGFNETNLLSFKNVLGQPDPTKSLPGIMPNAGAVPPGAQGTTPGTMPGGWPQQGGPAALLPGHQLMGMPACNAQQMQQGFSMVANPGPGGQPPMGYPTQMYVTPTGPVPMGQVPPGGRGMCPPQGGPQGQPQMGFGQQMMMVPQANQNQQGQGGSQMGNQGMVMPAGMVNGPGGGYMQTGQAPQGNDNMSSGQNQNPPGQFPTGPMMMAGGQQQMLVMPMAMAMAGQYQQAGGFMPQQPVQGQNVQGDGPGGTQQGMGMQQGMQQVMNPGMGQGMPNVGMNPGMGQQGMQQGMPQQGMPQQGMQQGSMMQ